MENKQFLDYKECSQLISEGITLINPTHYWVNMCAFSKDRGFELMTAEDAEYRTDETKYSAFIDFDDTIIALPVDWNENALIKGI